MFFLSCVCYAFVSVCLYVPCAGKGLTSWLSFVVSNCEYVTFPLVSWVRCGTWLYRFLIFAPLLPRCTSRWESRQQMSWMAGKGISYGKTCLNCHSKRRPKISFQDRLSLNAGQKYCRMLQESILQYFRTSLSYHLSLRPFFLSIFAWPLKTGFTVDAISLGHMLILCLLWSVVWQGDIICCIYCS